MTDKKNIATVVVPLPFIEGGLTYIIPEGMALQDGAYVLVPVGRKQYVGVVWSVGVETNVAVETLKPITEVYPLPPMQVVERQFIDRVADYTVSPVGMVLKMALSAPKAFEKPTPATGLHLLGASLGKIKLTAARKKVVEYLSEHGVMLQSDVLSQVGVGASVIKGLVELGVLEKVEMPADDSVLADGYNNAVEAHGSLPSLSGSQQEAASAMIETINNGVFSPFLLDGVTGSGKTEVFFAVIAKLLERDPAAQILILLPEIALTTQMMSRFEARFGFTPTAWHSGLTPSQRAKHWKDVASGRSRLVVGARSALFLPFNNLSFIVVDEEHDPSFKQEEGVIYHARDMAVLYASLLKIPVALSSATPSLESVVNVSQGKYHHLVLDSRFGEATLPEVQVVDMRQQKLNAQSWLSPILVKALVQNMERGQQSLLFINRRGYAPLVLCRNCGHRFQCKQCTSWLVEHKRIRKLQCHHCGYQEPMPKVCPNCEAEDQLVACGPGVERIEEEVRALFPQARVALITSDHVTSVSELSSALSEIESGGVDIIVGTQVIAKGHHFPKLTLVGVVDADLGLSGGDLRASERTFQLLHQVAGRAGREKDKGHVVLQSYMPDNAIIRALARGDREAFLNAESEGRVITSAPPFIRFSALVVASKNEMLAKRAAQHYVNYLRRVDGLDVLGPVPAPMFLLRGKYRFRILIKSARNVKVQQPIKAMMSAVKVPSTVSTKVDIDPYHFM
jgi:primosomal protein N' (replication factor Y)